MQYLSAISPPLVASAGFLVAFLLYRIYCEFVTYETRRKIIRDRGCRPAYKQRSQGLLGISFLRSSIKWAKQGKLLPFQQAQFYGHGTFTSEIDVLGRKFIQTAEPENVKTILSTNFKDYAIGPRRQRVFFPVLGPGIFSTDGTAWEHSRARVRPSFTRSQVADLDTFEIHVSNMINAIPKDRSVFDLQDLFFRLTIDSATEFLFGKSTDSLLPQTSQKTGSDFVDAYTYCLESMTFELRTMGLSHYIPDAKWRECRDTIHAYADNLVHQVVEFNQTADVEKSPLDSKHASPNDKSSRYVFLHQLVKETSDPVVLRSELLNILLAGRDTTASLLSNTWHILARRPDIWAKLKSEVDRYDGKRPDYAAIKDMKYLKYVLNESLRLRPVVPANARRAIRDNVLPLGGGPDGKSPLFVKAGTTVSYQVYVMHRRKDFFGEDAEEFKPERWENLRPGWEYLPFNGGPRICLGQQFALMEASYATIRLIQTFKEIKPGDAEPWKEWLTLTMASGTGCKVSMIPV